MANVLNRLVLAVYRILRDRVMARALRPAPVRTVSGLLAAALLSSCTTLDNGADFIVSNVTIYNGTGERGFVGSVAVRDGRFAYISRREVKLHSSREIDGQGKYLVPGLWDMHVHVRASGGESLDVSAFTKHGVTTIRDLGSLSPGIRALQNATRTNPQLPSIYSSIAALNGKAFAPYQRLVTQVEDLPKALDEQVLAGAVQIKIHRAFPPSLLRQVIKLSHARGLKVTGHIPMGVHPLEACDAGMDGVEHIGSFLEAYISVTPKATPQDAISFMLSSGAEPLYRCLALHRVSVTPTLVLYPAVARARSSGAENAAVRDFINGTRRITQRLFQRGVSLVAGTDTSDVGDLGLRPGEALLDEVEALQESGIPPLDVLKIATGNAAAALGVGGTTGLIEAGQPADFILLEHDPGVDVRALRSPLAVYHRGTRIVPKSMPEAAGSRSGMRVGTPNAHAAGGAMW